ncbi:MAG: hypothetical protein ACKOZV_00850 [Bacteroidota bacterium]
MAEQEIPDGHFTLAELQIFQKAENTTLEGVDYYIWLDTESEQPVWQFLLAIELKLGEAGAVIVSAGEDTDAIRVIQQEELLKTAAALFRIHGKPVIQRASRDHQAPWNWVMNSVLQAVRLSRGDEGHYLNDALMLDFGDKGLVIALNQDGGGLLIREHGG